MSHYVVSRSARPLGARYTGPVPLAGLGAVNPFSALEDRVERIVKVQSDRILDNVGERFSLYLDSTPGQKFMDKIGVKVEESVLDSLYDHKLELALAGVSVMALAMASVSIGSKLGRQGTQIAGLVGVLAALPVIFGSSAETEEERLARKAADRARRRGL